ncbi:hypothetical protein Hanom_Chr07g00652451 [Helianthus anomalus]
MFESLDEEMAAGYGVGICAENGGGAFRPYVWCEVRVEGLETLDYFDNLSKREGTQSRQTPLLLMVRLIVYI